ncbi:MAG: endonuclease/exonuclease/phosphatase family protein [Nanoarchaeota archaeon]|nr:endonuclease/exonuclease/phosphatase family protein [Nanoarchaeota archaeon]
MSFTPRNILPGILSLSLTSCLGIFEVVHLNGAPRYEEAASQEDIRKINFVHLNAADLRGNTPFLFESISAAEAHRHARWLADSLLKENVDIISLNEVDYAGTVKTGGLDQPKLIAEYMNTPYDYVVFDQYMKLPLWITGNAVISRFPMRAVHRHLYGDKNDADSRIGHLFKDFIHTEIRIGNKKLDLITTHLDDGSEDNSTRKGEAQEIAGYITELKEKNPNSYIVAAGDYNDSHDSETMKIILSSGLYPPKNFGLKTYQNGDPTQDLDHIVASPNIRIHDYRTFAFPWSDHVGLICELEFLE